jgi:hypothetical protein
VSTRQGNKIRSASSAYRNVSDNCVFGWHFTAQVTFQMSRAAHRRIYSFFTALRAPSFIHIYTKTHHIPLPQLVQAVTSDQAGSTKWNLLGLIILAAAFGPTGHEENLSQATSYVPVCLSLVVHVSPNWASRPIRGLSENRLLSSLHSPLSSFSSGNQIRPKNYLIKDAVSGKFAKQPPKTCLLLASMKCS